MYVNLLTMNKQICEANLLKDLDFEKQEASYGICHKILQ